MYDFNDFILFVTSFDSNMLGYGNVVYTKKVCFRGLKG
jgi:hypothetical protein